MVPSNFYENLIIGINQVKDKFVSSVALDLKYELKLVQLNKNNIAMV